MSADSQLPRRVFVIGGALVLALSIATVGVLWSRPLASEADVEEVGRHLTEALLDARDGRCARPVLRGEAIRGDATAELVALVDPSGRFAACGSLVDARHDEVVRALLWDSESSLELPVDDGATGGPMTPPAPAPAARWEYTEIARTLRRFPLPIESEILEACRGLDEAVEHIVAHESVCTPFSIGARYETPAHVTRLIKALAILARERMRRGETRRGMELLLDGVRLAMDLQRGRPELIGAMIGVAATALGLSQIQGLVTTELPWQPGDLQELERQALLLPAAPVSPVRWMVDDQVGVARAALEARGWSPPAGLPPLAEPFPIGGGAELEDGVLAYVAFMRRRFGRFCAGATTREACAAALAAETASAQAGGTGPAVMLGRAVPRLSRDGLLRGLYADGVPALAPYVQRAVRQEAVVRALPVLFVHRRLAREGSCPDASTLEAAIVALPLADGFGGRFSVLPTTIEYRPLDICAPSWLAPAGAGLVRLPVLRVYCPAFPISDAPVPSSDTESPSTGVTDLAVDVGAAAPW